MMAAFQCLQVKDGPSPGSAPHVRWSISQTVRAGKPSLQRVTRGRAHAEVIGPVVPAETAR